MIACLLLVRTRVRVSTQHFGPDWQHTGPWRGGFRHRCVHVVARVSAEQLRGQRGGPFGVLDVAGALLMVMVSSLNLGDPTFSAQIAGTRSVLSNQTTDTAQANVTAMSHVLQGIQRQATVSAYSDLFFLMASFATFVTAILLIN